MPGVLFNITFWSSAADLLQRFERLVVPVTVVQDVQQLVQDTDLRLKNLTLVQLEHFLVFCHQVSDDDICAAEKTTPSQHKQPETHVGCGWHKQHLNANILHRKCANLPGYSSVTRGYTCLGGEVGSDSRNSTGERDIYSVPQVSGHAALRGSPAPQDPEVSQPIPSKNVNITWFVFLKATAPKALSSSQQLTYLSKNNEWMQFCVGPLTYSSGHPQKAALYFGCKWPKKNILLGFLQPLSHSLKVCISGVVTRWR